MPMFVFIAGVVFALKPISPSGLGGFFTGKVRRLLLPGAVAICLSAAVTSFFGLGTAPQGPVWHLAVFPYLHFWFLWSIFLIFVFYAPLDALTRGRALLPCLVVALIVYLAHVSIRPNVFSINGALFLLPYFLAGALFLRSLDAISRHRSQIVMISAVVVLAASTANISIYSETGAFSSSGRDLQTISFAVGGCLLTFLILPVLPGLAWFGAFSFTVYLYHVFGTSAARRALDAAGIETVFVHLALGTLAGFAVPIALHLLARRHALTSLVLLGIRHPPRPTCPDPA